MKKRLLSFALAVTMLFGSVNVAFADETSVPEADPVVTEEVTPVADDTESGSAVEDPTETTTEETEGTVAFWDTTSPWQATVFGDCGGQDRINAFGDPSDVNGYPNGDGVYIYDVTEDGSDVTVRMGIPNYDDPTANSAALGAQLQGKIAGSSEGIVYYYQQISSDVDYTLSATAHVNGLCNSNSQVSFGAMVRETVKPYLASNAYPEEFADYGDSIAAAVLDMDKVGTGSMKFAFTRQNGTQNKDFKSTKTATPMPGDDIEISITKQGNLYTLNFGGETTQIDASDFSLSGDIYVGFFASRCADITFKDVKLTRAGELEEAEWVSGGNGNNGKEENLTADIFAHTITSDFSAMTLAIKGSKAQGKLSNGEDSYYYTARTISSSQDFELTANIDKMTLGTISSGNYNQMATGFIMFDEPYVKADDGSGVIGNNLFVGLMPTSNAAGAPYKITARKRLGETVTTQDIILDGLGNTGDTVENTSLEISKAGNIVKATVNGESVNIDVTDLFTHDDLYVGYMVARDGSIEVSNNNIEAITRSVVSVEVNTPLEHTEYYATQPFDATGLSFKVIYSDGEEVIVSSPEDYSLMGFDDASNQSFNTIGEKTVTAYINGFACELNITVRPMKVVSMNVDYSPIYDTFYVGGKFNFTGLQVSATYEDGSTSVLSEDNYELSIGDTVITQNGTTITEDMVSPDVAIDVDYVATSDSIDAAGAKTTFYVAVDPGKLTALEVATRSFQTTYYVGDEAFDTTGLTVRGVYTDGNTTRYQLISSDLYEIVGFDASQVNNALELRIQLKDDPSIYGTITVEVVEATPLIPQVDSYPRLTFNVNEAFDADGLKLGVLYSNEKVKYLSEEAFYYYDGTEYYKIYNEDVTNENGEVVFTEGQKVTVTADELNNADFYIDLTSYDNTKVGTTQVSLVLNQDKYGVAAQAPESPIVWDVSIVESTDYIWKATIFGASSLGYSGSAPSYVRKNTTDGSQTSNAAAANVTPELMENGKLPSNITSIDIASWGGSGKVTGDHDGMAYYYTKVDPNNNFTLSADITVNKYIVDPDNLSATDKAKYDGYIAAGSTPEEAINQMRSGQEAFGIMARDVVPLTGSMQDGKYTGNSNGITNVAKYALTRAYTFTKADGSSVTYTAPVDAYESNMDGTKVVDENGEARVTVPGADAPSNMVVAGGITDSTYPTNPSSSTYQQKIDMNRINIMTRYNSDRIGFYATTTHVPMKGDKYNITLTKMNTGYMITTYDYNEGTTSTQYLFEGQENISNVLTAQDSESIYVGFFAARYADITVENVELHETQTATDPIITGIVNEAVAPSVTISSPSYTSSVNYTLKLKSNATKGVMGGLTSISLNGKNIQSDMILGNRATDVQCTLEPNTVNNFSIVYYPNTADNFTNYDPIITRFTVTHKSSDEINDLKNIYVAPNGTLSGDGTRNNPVTLEMALDLVDYGGQVVMLDGTYNLTNETLGKISLDTGYSGYQNGNFKALVADEGASPVIDLQKKYEGFEVDADYWYFKGFSVINSKDNSNGLVLGGDHCVVENCTFVNNGDTGMQISRVNSDDNNVTVWPSYNLIKSCESYNNCDPSQNNADGFAAKLTVGYGNVFEDCISHHNVDDGWDLYTKIESGAIGAVVLENCITYRNGFQLNEATGTDTLYSSPEGNGFKLGGESIYVEHMLKDCISFENYGSGVNSNNNPAMIIRNVIAYRNGYQADSGYNFNLKSGATEVLTDAQGNTRDESGRSYKFNYDIKGAVSYATRDAIGSWNDDVTFGNISANPIDSESNYLCYTGTVGTNSLGEAVDPSTFFVSTDSSTVLTGLRYSRNEDGSFNHGDFLARVTPYEHDAADTVTLPDIYGGKGGVGVGGTTEGTTSDVTEVTTTAPKRSSGAGGGGSVKNYVATTTTEGTTSEVVEEDSTEATTESVVFTDSVSVQVGSTEIKINDSTYTMDVAPYIQTSSNSTMVPLRFVSIALAGGSVASADSSDLIVWDAATKTATITAGDNTIVFTAGSGTYTVNGNTLNISNQAVAEIVDGRMFVPFRTIGEALGAEVSWDANTKTAMYN